MNFRFQGYREQIPGQVGEFFITICNLLSYFDLQVAPAAERNNNSAFCYKIFRITSCGGFIKRDDVAHGLNSSFGVIVVMVHASPFSNSRR